ncbi:MAG TPA: hypothetical protein VK701_07390 [Solirubrobacteraceae bacterium]|nr:hypothetical protein [Solirubrobacteraceae bacterium]
MAQERIRGGKPLTPEQARKAHRWMRLLVLAAVLQAWTAVALVALIEPHRQALLLAAGMVYALAAPLLLRYLTRDIDRRVAAGDELADGSLASPISRHTITTTPSGPTFA